MIVAEVYYEWIEKMKLKKIEQNINKQMVSIKSTTKNRIFHQF